MHLSDDEYEILWPYHIPTFRPKKSSKTEIRLQTIGFLIVFTVFVMIYSKLNLLKTSHINIEGTPYNKTYLQYINESMYKSRRFRMELIKNRSADLTDYDVTLSLKNFPSGLIEAGDRVREMYHNILFDPVSKLKLKYNFSKEFYEANRGKAFYDYDSDPLTKYFRNSKPICEGKDWVSCNGFQCKVIQEVLDKMPMISCYYSDLVYVNDNNYHIYTSIRVDGDAMYYFEKTDHIKIFCHQFGKSRLPFDFDKEEFWIGLKTGFRPVYNAAPPHRLDTPNVLILVLDSIPYNKFHEYFPQAYTILTQDFKAVVLQNYNINESDSLTAFDIKKVGFKLQDKQNLYRNIYLYPDNCLFTSLHDDGYYTAYFTDLPMVSSNNTKYQADYKLSHFFEENDKMSRADKQNMTFSDVNCVGDTPKYALLMNITLQYTQIPGKRFSFTLISNITNYPRWGVEDNLVYFLRHLRHQLKDTLFILITSKIFSKTTPSTPNVEDLNQLVFIVMPWQLIEDRPGSWHTLMANSHAYITPFDLDAIILGAVGLDYLGNVTDSELSKGRNLQETQIDVRQQITWNPIPPTL